MIAATATFAVMKHQPLPDVVQVLTILIGLTDSGPYDALAPMLPTYEEAVRIVTERGLARQPRIEFLKQIGIAEYVPVCERVVFSSADELDALSAAMV